MLLSRKDPAYVGRAKEVQKAQKAIEAGECPVDALARTETGIMDTDSQELIRKLAQGNLGVGSTIFAVKPGDGSAREQAASCQKVLRRMGKYRNMSMQQSVIVPT